MNKYLRYFLVGILVVGLILVRYFENQLFYDPFLAYFKGDFFQKPLPDYQMGKIAVHIIFRFFLNGLLSLGIIGFLFWDKRKSCSLLIY